MKDVEKIGNLNINYQFKPLTICPLPPRVARLDYIDLKDGKKKSKYVNEVDKVLGSIKIKIIGSEKYGLPSGRDILVILYLIRTALIQNQDGVITSRSFLTDYLRMFDIEPNDQGYNEAKKRFKRIRYANWYWDENYKGGETSTTFRIIENWCVFFDDNREQSSLYDSYIELAKPFWDYIKNKKIPYDLNTLKKIKDKPFVINLYLWLVYRVYDQWERKKNQPVFIPFFGPNGLMSQLSSNITRKEDFKSKMIHKYIPLIRNEWPNCPVFLEKDFSKEKPKNLGRKREFKDGITIHVESASQLQIPPHWPKKLRQAREEANALAQAEKEAKDRARERKKSNEENVKEEEKPIVEEKAKEEKKLNEVEALQLERLKEILDLYQDYIRDGKWEKIVQRAKKG